LYRRPRNESTTGSLPGVGYMATYRKHQRNVVESYSLEGLKMGLLLFTEASSGLYEARFVGACVEKTRGGTHRLLMKFKILGGPCSFDDIGGWKRSRKNAGRILPLWAELKMTPEGELTLSPNHWIAGGLADERGTDLEQKIMSRGDRVRWVCVKKEEGHPAHVCCLSYSQEAPDIATVESLVGGTE